MLCLKSLESNQQEDDEQEQQNRDFNGQLAQIRQQIEQLQRVGLFQA